MEPSNDSLIAEIDDVLASAIVPDAGDMLHALQRARDRISADAEALANIHSLTQEVQHQLDGVEAAFAAAEARAQGMEAALRAAKPELDATLEMVGGCDHDVGMCSCSLIRAISLTSAALAPDSGKERHVQEDNTGGNNPPQQPEPSGKGEA